MASFAGMEWKSDDTCSSTPSAHDRLFLFFSQLWPRFQRTGNQQDLDWSIAIARILLDSCPPTSPNRLMLLQNLASARYVRFQKFGYMADLERAIVLWRDFLKLCPQNYEHRFVWECNLSTALSIRNKRLGRFADLDEIIELRLTTLSFVSDPRARLETLNDLISAFLNRFQQIGKVDDLNEAVRLSREALALTPERHENRLSSLSTVAHALESRFMQTGMAEDLSESIQLRREAMALSPPEHPNRFSSLNNLAGDLATSFMQTGVVEDLNESIGLNRDALALCHEGHPRRPLSLSNLGYALQIRFEYGGKPEDLSEAIKLHSDALALRPEGHPERSTSLRNLSISMLARFKQSGREEDLNESIQLSREALVLLEGDLDRTEPLNCLANALRTRFELTGRAEDLRESIQLSREALILYPLGHPDRLVPLNNLANSLWIHVQQGGRTEDPGESIQLSREALTLCPVGHPDRPVALNNLANALMARFKRTESPGDLDEAILSHRSVLNLLSKNHPYRSASLGNLSGALWKRFERSGHVDDLNEAIKLIRDALALLPEGHPHHPGMLVGLAHALNARFEKEGQLQDYEDCISLLRNAATQTLPGSLIGLQAAYSWASYAHRRDHSTTLTAYRTASALLQRALTIRPTLSSRHSFLSSKVEYQGLCVDAVSYAIGKGNFTAAVELLEQGRALLWSRMRGVRTPLDRLAELDKPLADRFSEVCRRLEALMTSSESQLTDQGMKGGFPLERNRHSADAMMEYSRRLTEEQEKIIGEIREVPGFEDFLREASFENLQEAASEGPVVVVNYSRFRCDALVLLSNRDEPCVNVPLDEEWCMDAAGLFKDLLLARYERGVHSTEYDETLKRVMKTLWDRVVSKVVQKLRELGILQGSRIWWCPTFVMSWFPFHAAGPYEDEQGRKRYLLDDYISSYTPTLMSLIAARSGARNGAEKFLFVGDTSLKATKKELAAVRKHRRVGRCLLDDQASRDSVIKALRRVEWVHFACHGKLELDEPFKSSFALPGGALTLLDIAKARLPNAEFAFLSACHTAEPTIANDEALNLAAAIQFCGFRSVVGTMWQLLDRDGPLLAEAVYTHLTNDVEEGELRFKGAAAAVREAALFLRSQKDWTDGGREVDIATERWVNLVHIGA